MSHSDYWNNQIPYMDSMRYYAGIHSDIQGCIKIVNNKDGNAEPEDWLNNIHHTTPQSFNFYVMVWFVTGESRVMDRNSNLLHGEESILGGESSLPVGIALRNMSGSTPIGIVIDYDEFFSDGV